MAAGARDLLTAAGETSSSLQKQLRFVVYLALFAGLLTVGIGGLVVAARGDERRGSVDVFKAGTIMGITTLLLLLVTDMNVEGKAWVATLLALVLLLGAAVPPLYQYVELPAALDGYEAQPLDGFQGMSPGYLVLAAVLALLGAALFLAALGFNLLGCQASFCLY